MIEGLASRKFSLLFKLTVFSLAITGAAQMPIFKRYYIADIPGFGWLGDFYLTNKLHYLFGAVLLYCIAYLITAYLGVLSYRFRLTESGKIKSVLFIFLAATGVLRVVKNLNFVTMNPELVMIIDWAHLSLAILLGLAAILFWVFGNKKYLTERRLSKVVKEKGNLSG